MWFISKPNSKTNCPNTGGPWSKELFPCHFKSNIFSAKGKTSNSCFLKIVKTQFSNYFYSWYYKPYKLCRMSFEKDFYILRIHKQTKVPMKHKIAKMHIPVCKEFIKMLFHESWKSFSSFEHITFSGTRTDRLRCVDPWF